MHNASPAALSVLEPDALRHPRDVTTAPRQPGIYGWWFKHDSLDVPHADYQCIDGFELLYIGIAPRKPSAAGSRSKSTLRRRLSEHVNEDASRSTLRRTLGTLLVDRLSLDLRFYSRRAHYGPHEATLTRWIHDHARVAWAEHAAPWKAEDELLEHAALALNIKGRTDAFATALHTRRIDALAAAKRASPAC